MSIQGRAVQRAVLPAVIMVVAAWWAAFFIYEFAVYPRWFITNFGVLLSHIWQTLVMVAYGATAGVGVALFIAHVKRQDKADALAKGALRNLTTTMGAIPIVASEPQRAAVPPILSTFGEPGEKVGGWLKAMATISPAHARLMDALLRVLNHDPLLPATHVPGGHGGKTLLQHSLLVTQAMLELAPSWSYDGLRNKKGDIVIGLRNPAYKFNPNDPVLAIVALAHDIGKIESYIKKGGKVVDSRHAHDVVGARMIARMPEFWGIPKEDRDVIVLAIAHYHHPQDLPMHEDGRAIDDRTIAVQEILIKADKAAGKIESGTVYENTMGVTAAEGEESPAAKLVDDEVLYNAFIEIIHEPGRINGKDSATRVGQKHGGMLYLAESALRVAMIRKLGLSSAPLLGDGRSALTVQLMELLSERGLLMQEFGGKTYSFKRAMFRVAFFNSRTGKHLADWPAVLVVNPGSNLPQISSMVDHLSRVEITRPVWGESSAKGKAASTTAPIPSVDLSLADATDEDSSTAVDDAPAAPVAALQEEDALLDVFDSVMETQDAPPSAAQPATATTDDDDLIGALMGDDPLGGGEEQTAEPVASEDVETKASPSNEIVFVDEESGLVFEVEPSTEPAAPVSAFSFEVEDDEDPPPDIPEEVVEDVPQVVAPATGSVEAFNRVAKKLGGDKPLKGLDKGHLNRLGDKLQEGVDAALADLERKPSGRPYSRAMLLVEKEKLKELLRTGSITLYSSGKGRVLALDEVVAARGRFGWDEAVSEAESGEHDVFTVIRSGERIFLKFAEFQTQ